jgi:hypothetical protein
VPSHLRQFELLLQVTDLISDIRRTLADCIFCVSAQSGLSKNDTIRLVTYLSRDKSLGQDGALSDVTLVLTMALLYAVDVRILELDDRQGLLQLNAHYLQLICMMLSCG